MDPNHESHACPRVATAPAMPRVEDPGHLASTESSPNAPSAPGPGKPLPCLWAADPGTPCLRLFNDPLELYNHLTEAHFVDESETVCRWVSCNTNLRPFAKRDMALSHCWSHVNYKAFACPICGTTFKWIHDLRKHCTRANHKIDPSKGPTWQAASLMPTTSDLACLQQSSTSNTLKPAREPKKSKPLASLRRTPTQISDAVSETVSNNGGDFSSPVTGRREGLRVKPKRKYNESDPEDEDWDDPKNLIPQKTKPTVIAKTEDATTQVADRPVWRYGAPQVQPPPLPHSSEPHFVPQLGFQGSRMSPLPPTHYYYNVQDGSQAPHNYHARPQKDFPSEGSQHPYYSSNGPPQGYNTPPHHQPSPQPHYPSSQLQSHNFPTPPQLLSGNPLPPKPYFVNHPQTQSFPFPHQLYLSPVTLPPSQNSPQNSIAGHPSMQQPIQHYSSMHSHYTIQQPHYFVSYSGYPNARPSPQCSEAQYSAWPGWRPNHQTNPAAPAHMMQSVPRRSPLLPPPHRIQSLSHYSPVHPPHTMQPVPASPQTPSNEFVNSQESRKVVSRDGLDALAAVCRWEKAA